MFIEVRDGLAINTEHIVAITVEPEEELNEVFEYCATAYSDDGTKYILEWFERQEEAEAWISKLVNRISHNKNIIP